MAEQLAHKKYLYLSGSLHRLVFVLLLLGIIVVSIHRLLGETIMSAQIFYRERQKVKDGSKTPRYRVAAVAGVDLKIYTQTIFAWASSNNLPMQPVPSW
jgi:Ca2+/Na+ antiporter